MPPKLLDLIMKFDRILDRAGIEAPRQNVERILEQILGLKKIDLYLAPHRQLTQEENDRLESMIDRRLAHEPLQYILGETEFYGLRLKCDRRALIPRPETEFVVAKGLKLIGERHGLKVLDLATGSGNIVIALAMNNLDQEYFASDLSSEAVALAKENAALHGIAEKIQIYCGNLFDPFANIGFGFDLIISNPPYIREDDCELLHEQIRFYEPRRALLGGEDGLEIVRQMLIQAPSHLSPRGYLVSEIGLGQADEVRKLISADRRFNFIESVIDYRGIERVIVLQKT